MKTKLTYIAAISIAVLALSSCTIAKITVQGKLGEYSFKPYRAVVIESEDAK